MTFEKYFIRNPNLDVGVWKTLVPCHVERLVNFSRTGVGHPSRDHDASNKSNNFDLMRDASSLLSYAWALNEHLRHWAKTCDNDSWLRLSWNSSKNSYRLQRCVWWQGTLWLASRCYGSLTSGRGLHSYCRDWLWENNAIGMPLLIDETKNKIVIVISPLNELELEQVRRLFP